MRDAVRYLLYGETLDISYSDNMKCMNTLV
jgi:hypothetical protein